MYHMQQELHQNYPLTLLKTLSVYISARNIEQSLPKLLDRDWCDISSVYSHQLPLSIHIRAEYWPVIEPYQLFTSTRGPGNIPFSSTFCFLADSFGKVQAASWSIENSDQMVYVLSISRHFPLHLFVRTFLAVFKRSFSSKYVLIWYMICGWNFYMGVNRSKTID